MDETNIKEESALFESNDECKKFTFKTNDTKYLHQNGYTLWTVPNTNANDEFESITIEAMKESGTTEAGFGIVFCAQEIDSTPFMLTVLINANGFYTIGKVLNGTLTHINNGWENSNYINRGTGFKNLICISYESKNKNFILKLNDYEITTFTVAEKITFKNSRSGFAVVIAHNENFPSNPVSVTFENK